MARYNVYANPDGAGYWLDVQADLLESLNTRLVVPLMPVSASPTPAKRPNPVFDIDSERVVMVTQFLSAVPASMLKTPVVSLVQHDTEITSALDMALTGVLSPFFFSRQSIPHWPSRNRTRHRPPALPPQPCLSPA